MSDNILSAVLTFSLLAGGTAAIGSEVFESRHVAQASTPVIVMPQVNVIAQRASEVVTLPAVTITAHRQPADVVTLPTVVVTGKRDAVTVAVETRASEAPRIE